MATFSFDKVNKIVTIVAPTTEVTCQELINAIRDWEDELTNMEVAKVANASGKESLGGGLSVGITLELLNNWQLKFEDRSGPDFIQCTVKDGNLVGGVAGNPIKESDYTQVKLILSAAGTIAETGVSGLTPEESEALLEIGGVKSKTDNLPADPTSKSELEAVHGVGSWEGATPTQVWNHGDRKLTSRNIESAMPGEHLPSEEQVEALKNPAADGFDREKDSLKKLSEKLNQILAQPAKVGARAKV